MIAAEHETASPELRGAFRVASRLLGEDVWLVVDDAAARDLEANLAAEGDDRLVFTAREVAVLEGMLEDDARALARVKREFRGARILRRLVQTESTTP